MVDAERSGSGRGGGLSAGNRSALGGRWGEAPPWRGDGARRPRPFVRGSIPAVPLGLLGEPAALLVAIEVQLDPGTGWAGFSSAVFSECAPPPRRRRSTRCASPYPRRPRSPSSRPAARPPQRTVNIGTLTARQSGGTPASTHRLRAIRPTATARPSRSAHRAASGTPTRGTRAKPRQEPKTARCNYLCRLERPRFSLLQTLPKPLVSLS